MNPPAARDGIFRHDGYGVWVGDEIRINPGGSIRLSKDGKTLYVETCLFPPEKFHRKIRIPKPKKEARA